MKKTISVLLCAMLIFLSGCHNVSSEPAVDYSESWRDRPIPESFDLRNVDTDGDGQNHQQDQVFHALRPRTTSMTKREPT